MFGQAGDLGQDGLADVELGLLDGGNGVAVLGGSGNDDLVEIFIKLFFFVTVAVFLVVCDPSMNEL